MSDNCSSGIPIHADLDSAFGSCRQNENVRFLKVQIVDDIMTETGRYALSPSLKDDWNAVRNQLKRDEGCYIIFRLDSTNMHGYEWMLLSYVPDGSPVKQRMLYASSHSNLKRALGLSYFGSEMHASSPEDLTWDLFEQHTAKHAADAPLTNAEMQTHSEITAEVDLGRSREYVHSVAFPMSVDAANALKALPSGKNLVQLVVDPSKETIELHKNASVPIQQLSSQIPVDSPCFTFYRHDHTHDGSDISPVVFIYSCADDSPIKLRMLFSTVKAAAVDAAVQQGITIEKKLEVSAPDEVSESIVMEELHPADRQITTKLEFSKPKGPAGRNRSRPTRRK